MPAMQSCSTWLYHAHYEQVHKSHHIHVLPYGITKKKHKRTVEVKE